MKVFGESTEHTREPQGCAVSSESTPATGHRRSTVILFKNRWLLKPQKVKRLNIAFECNHNFCGFNPQSKITLYRAENKSLSFAQVSKVNSQKTSMNTGLRNVWRATVAPPTLGGEVGENRAKWHKTKRDPFAEMSTQTRQKG